MQVCQIIERSCLSSAVHLKYRFNWGPVISFAKLHGLKFERMLAEVQVFSNLSGAVSLSLCTSLCMLPCAYSGVFVMECVLWSVYVCVSYGVCVCVCM